LLSGSFLRFGYGFLNADGREKLQRAAAQASKTAGISLPEGGGTGFPEGNLGLSRQREGGLTEESGRRRSPPVTVRDPFREAVIIGKSS
jgi:hypothetical protein